MGMNVGDSGDEEDAVINAINTTPGGRDAGTADHLLITIPVVTQTVPLALPKEANMPRQTKPENIEISVNHDGDIFWNAKRLSGTDELVDKLKVVAVIVPQPEVQIRGDADARYEFVGRVVYSCQRAGILKIGFITEPPPRG